MVRLGSYPRGAVPEVRYTRLDEYYRPAVELARLIIENSSLELFGGQVSGASFLIDMSVAFYLRQSLSRSNVLIEALRNVVSRH